MTFAGSVSCFFIEKEEVLWTLDYTGFILNSICYYSRCGENGFCHEYDHRGLALVVLAVIMTCKVITNATFFLSWLFSRRDADSRHDTTNNQETHF